MAYTAPIGGDYKPVAPLKLHPAVCTAFVVLGTQVSQYGETKKCWLQFELQDEQREFDGKPYKVKVSQIFTLSVNQKANLRKFLESWRGAKMTDEQAASFDLSVLPGKPAAIMVVNEEKNGKTIPKIDKIVRWQPEAGQPPTLTPTQEPVLFLMGPNEPIPTSLPKWVVDMITSSPDFLTSTTGDEPCAGPEEDPNALPF